MSQGLERRKAEEGIHVEGWKLRMSAIWRVGRLSMSAMWRVRRLNMSAMRWDGRLCMSATWRKKG